MTNTNPTAAPAAPVAPTTVVVNAATAPGMILGRDKSTGLAYVLLIFLGIFGVHQFYIGKIGRGVLYLLTGGILGVGVVIDLFTLARQVRQVNAMRRVGL